MGTTKVITIERYTRPRAEERIAATWWQSIAALVFCMHRENTEASGSSYVCFLKNVCAFMSKWANYAV